MHAYLRCETLSFLPHLNVIVVSDTGLGFRAICGHIKAFLPEFMPPMHISDTNRIGHMLFVRWAEPNPHNSFECVTVMAALIVGLSHARELFPGQGPFSGRQPIVTVHRCRNFFPIKGLYL